MSPEVRPGHTGSAPRRARRSPAPPLVSCVLIATDPSRFQMVRHAISLYAAQTYPCKEMVLWNTTGVPVTRPEKAITIGLREVATPGDENVGLGALRGAAAAQANGEWIVPWDDDDHYHPERVTRQMAVRREGMACMLTHQLRVDITAPSGFVHHRREGVPSTIIYPAGTPDRYDPALAYAEEEAFAALWIGRTVLLRNDAYPDTCLCTAVYHPQCVSSRSRFMPGHDSPEHGGVFAMPPGELRHVTAAMAFRGLELTPSKEGAAR